MDISSIRAKARQVKSQTQGIYALYLIPILANIISLIYRYNNNSSTYAPSAPTDSAALASQTQDMLQTLLTVGAIVTMISGIIFSVVMAIIISLFKVSAQFKTLEILRGSQEPVGFKDSLRAFNNDIFGKVFSTIFLKHFLLFLWGLVSSIGGFMTLGSSVAIVLYAITGTSSPALVSALGIGLLLSILGWVIAIPQQYAYSQVEYILYDQLEKGQYSSAFTIIKESRRIMRGYKFKRFTLDLTFVGWWILSGFTLGIVGVHVIPYQEIANTIFYEELRQGNIR